MCAPAHVQVYEGRVQRARVEVSELGGGKRKVDRVAAGVDILALDQNDLEFDESRDARDAT